MKYLTLENYPLYVYCSISVFVGIRSVSLGFQRLLTGVALLYIILFICLARTMKSWEFMFVGVVYRFLVNLYPDQTQLCSKVRLLQSSLHASHHPMHQSQVILDLTVLHCNLLEACLTMCFKSLYAPLFLPTRKNV